MKRTFSVLIALTALFSAAVAQNNPYEIDDECYQYFNKADLLAGQDGYEEYASKLLNAAIIKGDTKAQTLYYVAQLKDVIRRVPGNEPTTRQQDESVIKAQEALKQVSEKLGYPQYFYYSYELVQNYFYNHGNPVRTMELVQEMQTTALKRGEPYGEWMGYRYLTGLYIAQNDYVSAKRFIRQAIEMHDKSSDPTIRKQSVCRLYCDLADTYPVGTDSSRLYVAKAMKAARVHMDTLRCHYYLARSTALHKNIQEYRRHRDYCLADPSLGVVSRTAPQMFSIIDSMIDGDMSETLPSVSRLSKIREIKFIANIAEVYGFKEEAFAIEKQLVVRNELRLAEVNQSKLSEMNARMGNNTLTAELESATEKVLRITRHSMILLTLILLGIVTFLVFHIRTLRKTNIKLQEANEKVTLANAAKTRFVQNMSHEVRTPLNAIVGFSQLLSLPDGSFPEEEKAEFASHIINNTKMLTMLLDDILNTSAMDSGNYRINYEDGECGFIAQAAISSAEHRLQPGVQLRYEQDFEGEHYFRTDPQRTQQIIINLLTNACKHTTEGEIVLKCSLSENPGKVTYSVTDTGTGVPVEQAEAIFNRFTKLNEFVQGTGLGLSICRDIAGKMGGQVFLDTSYTKGGARFVFTLPEKAEEK